MNLREKTKEFQEGYAAGYEAAHRVAIQNPLGVMSRRLDIDTNAVAIAETMLQAARKEIAELKSVLVSAAKHIVDVS